MSVHSTFDNARPALPPADFAHPIVLRFANLKPKDLGRFKMHDRRAGGDLAHVDLSRISLNRTEHGGADWSLRFTRRILQAARKNLGAQVLALREKGRIKDAERCQQQGRVPPWNGNTDAPLREGILTVNKAWFGGSGADEWDADKLAEFRVHAMSFLRKHFPKGQLVYAASHSDEEAFHIHFVVAVWKTVTTANRGKQIVLKAADNPLLRSYEHAQDLAGAHFEPLGIVRGERRAEARRKARAEGRKLPAKRYHVAPSQYRAQERLKGRLEAEALRHAARQDCGAAVKKTRQRASAAARKLRGKQRQAEQNLASAKESADILRTEKGILRRAVASLEDRRDEAVVAREEARREQDAILDNADATAAETINHALLVATKLVRKSRKRAKACMADAERRVRASEVKKQQAEAAAATAHRAKKVQEALAHEAATDLVHREKAVRLAKEQHEAQIVKLSATMAERARLAQEVHQCAVQLIDLKAELSGAKDDLLSTQSNLIVLKRESNDAEVSKRIAEEARTQAQTAVTKAEECASALKTASDKIAARTSAIERGLEFIADEVIQPGNGPRSWRFGRRAPSDKTAQHEIKTVVEVAGSVLGRIALAIANTVHALVARERANIARDAQILEEIRAKMGLDSDVDINAIRARYQDDELEPEI